MGRLWESWPVSSCRAQSSREGRVTQTRDLGLPLQGLKLKVQEDGKRSQKDVWDRRLLLPLTHETQGKAEPSSQRRNFLHVYHFGSNCPNCYTFFHRPTSLAHQRWAGRWTKNLGVWSGSERSRVGRG